MTKRRAAVNPDVKTTQVERSELPPGWCWVSLGELAAPEPNAITDGPFGSNLKTEHYTDCGPRVVRLQNIGDGIFRDISAYISERYFEKLRKHQVDAGDLVIAALGESLPRACLIPAWLGPAIVKADCIRFKPDERLVASAYLNYALNNEDARRRTSAIIHGVGRPRLNLTEIRSILVPLAPPPEQGRLVEKIEELLSDLDAGVASLRQAQATLKKYRAAVLRAAVTGELTTEWRAVHPNVEPATKLLDRILAERRRKWEEEQEAKFAASGRTPPKGWQSKYPMLPPLDSSNLAELPPNWCWASVNQVGEVRLGRQRSPAHHDGLYMRPYLRVANVFENRIDTNDVLQMNFTPAEYEVYRLEFGDILLNEGQSLHLVGRPAMYRDEVPGACFQNTLVRFRADPGVLPEYSLYLFLAYLHNRRFQKVARWTVNIAHLGADRFSSIEFPLPPVDEQRAIVAKVEQQLSDIEATDNYITASLKRAARLRQSILKEAFAGRLVPQDPNDEPASVLLERIRQTGPKAESLNGRSKARTRNPRQREFFE
ncbi:MAG TPA: restriction endonuclease subunit S [Gemmataceae bacterium]|jgi:type I restriction enzyme S subunit